MKAAILEKTMPIEKRPLSITDLPVPVPQKGQVLLKMEACGVCRSNLHMIEGDWLKVGMPGKCPIVPGHEIVGRIETLNDGGLNLNVGDGVGVQPLWSTCGVCDFCVTGREELCTGKNSTGETVDGGFGVHACRSSSRLSSSRQSQERRSGAAFFCQGVTAYSAVRKANLNPSDRVAVVGVGGAGQMVVQFAKLYGPEIIAIDNVEEHLEKAEELGASSSINSGKEEDFSKELLKNGGVDKSLIFAPNSKVASQMVRGTKPGGTVIIGVFAGIDEFPFADEKIVIGSVIGSREPMKEVLKIAESGRIKMPVEVFNLETANETLKLPKDRRVNTRDLLVP